MGTHRKGKENQWCPKPPQDAPWIQETISCIHCCARKSCLLWLHLQLIHMQLPHHRTFWKASQTPVSLQTNVLQPGERDREDQEPDWPRAEPWGDLVAEMGTGIQEGFCSCPLCFIPFLTLSSSHIVQTHSRQPTQPFVSCSSTAAGGHRHPPLPRPPTGTPGTAGDWNDSSSANCNHTGSGDVVGGREEGEGFIRAGKARQDLLCRLCAVQGCPALPHGTGMESQAPVWGMGTTCPMSTPCPSRATHVATPAWMLCFN